MWWKIGHEHKFAPFIIMINIIKLFKIMFVLFWHNYNKMYHYIVATMSVVQLKCSFSLMSRWTWHHLLQTSQLIASMLDQTSYVHSIHGWAGAIFLRNIINLRFKYTWVITYVCFVSHLYAPKLYLHSFRLKTNSTYSKYWLCCVSKYR